MLNKVLIVVISLISLAELGICSPPPAAPTVSTTPIPTPPPPVVETYKTVNGLNIRATVYNINSKLPKRVVIVAHVGGYKSGGMELGPASDVSRYGFMGVAIEYRLAPPHTPMNTPQHPAPGQDDIGDDGHYSEQTADVRDAIIHYRGDPRCNGEVVVIGGSAGGSHALYMAGGGTPGQDMPDLAVLLSCGISNLADLNSWSIVCVNGETCPHQAVANYLNITDTAPALPTGADLALAQIASPIHYLHVGMCPVWSMCSTKDSRGIPTSAGYSIHSYNQDSTIGPLEDGTNGFINKAIAAGLTESTASTPEYGTYKTTLVTVSTHEHAFDYWGQQRSAIITWIGAPIPHASPTPTATATYTPTPTATYTPTPSATYTPTPSATYTPTPSATYTPTPSATYTPTPSATYTPTPTDTPTPTPTDTPLPTPTSTPTDTPAPTPTDTPVPTPTDTPSLPAPKGIAAMLGKSTTIPTIVKTNTHIKYIICGAQWWQIEPTEHNFDWSAIDALVAQVPSTMKIKVGIAMSGLSKSQGDSVPDWAFAKMPSSELICYIDNNPYHPTYQQQVCIATAWSPTWIAMKVEAITAFGQHYAGNSRVQIAEAAVFTGTNNDWSIPFGRTVDGIPPTGSTITSRMLSAGYTFTKMVAAGDAVLNAYIAAFPNAVIIWPTGPNQLDSDPLALARKVRDDTRAKWGASHLMVANYGISNKMPFAPPPTTGDWQVLFESMPNTGGQALWNVSGDNTYRMNGGTAADPNVILEASGDKMKTYGRYYEIYLKDLTDPAMAPSITYIDSILTSTAGPAKSKAPVKGKARQPLRPTRHPTRLN